MEFHMTDCDDDTPGFRLADKKISRLVEQLVGKGACGRCVARALAYHGALLAELEMGSEEAIELLEIILENMREHSVSPSDPAPSTDVH
jgi:hypothetical protein